MPVLVRILARLISITVPSAPWHLLVINRYLGVYWTCNDYSTVWLVLVPLCVVDEVEARPEGQDEMRRDIGSVWAI